MKIWIDAGHGGTDPGAVGAKYKEKDLTLWIASRVKTLLERSGHTVGMTRKNDIFVSLNDRAKKSNAFKADMFCSIHINAGGGVGVETYSYSTGGTAEKYAKQVQNNLIALGRKNRGTKTANYAVLRLTAAPAILVECGFIDNKEEENWIVNHMDQLAEAIVNGITNKVVSTIIPEPVKIPEYKKTTAVHKYIGYTDVIEADPLTIGVYIADQIGSHINIANFVNGGYFMNQANGTTFAQHILVDNGNIISNYLTHGKPITTLCIFKDGTVQIKKISDITKEKGLKCAISGASLTDYAAEGFTGNFADITRATNRTYIGYRKSDNKILICVRPNTSIQRAAQSIKNLGADIGMTLDGGGSTCMRINGVWKYKTSRRINSILMWE